MNRSPSPDEERAMSAVADPNLLYGILAFQMDFVSQEELIDGLHAWVRDKQTPLGVLLQRHRVLTEEQHRALEVLVLLNLHVHADDVRRGLASRRVEASLQQQLGRIADAEVQDSVRSCDTDPFVCGQPSPAAAVPDVALRYRRLREHARGGLGAVSVALDTELQREVALKEIQDQYADHPDARHRFVREAEITGNLEHPG